MVALLNFGAASQKYHDYKTDSLVNANLTDEQRILVSKYSSDMAVKVNVVDSQKTGLFEKQGAGFMLYPTVDFDNPLMNLSYNLKTNKSVTGYVTLYYWDSETYNNAKILTKSNATGTLQMTKNSDGVYFADFSGIAASDIDDVIYTAVVFKSGSETYCSGVLSYSYAEFCKVHAESKTSDLRYLAQTTVVYGYYSKKYFAKS